jgi:carbonic anhydrase/acetyltransferase-like protein (isoleucine patch superfamily)
MPLFAFEGREPTVSPGAWIAPTATLVADVRVEADASIWYGRCSVAHLLAEE